MSDRQNTVTYQGKVFSIRDLHYTSSGKAVCSARMSINRKYDDKWEAVFFDLTAWEDAAETLADCQDKDEILVVGRLDVTKPYTKRDGEQVPAGFAITANRVERTGGASTQARAPSQPERIDPASVPF